MNDVEIQMLGLSRSGNHAIADWIYMQAPAPKLMLNCAEGKTNPYLSCRPLDSGRGWQSEPAGLYASGRAGRHRDASLLLHSYEDSWLGHAFSRDLEAHHDAWLGRSRRRISLIVLRDPFNLFASRLRADAGASGLAMRIWKQHARAVLGPQPALPGEFVPVLYNRWRSDPGYRQALADRLGLRFTDAGFDNVPACGGGSSFDGIDFDGKAAAMPTDQRWRVYADDPDYLRLFDAQAIALSTRLFGPPPPIPALAHEAAGPGEDQQFTGPTSGNGPGATGPETASTG